MLKQRTDNPTTPTSLRHSPHPRESCQSFAPFLSPAKADSPHHPFFRLDKVFSLTFPLMEKCGCHKMTPSESHLHHPQPPTLMMVSCLPFPFLALLPLHAKHERPEIWPPRHEVPPLQPTTKAVVILNGEEERAQGPQRRYNTQVLIRRLPKRPTAVLGQDIAAPAQTTLSHPYPLKMTYRAHRRGRKATAMMTRKMLTQIHTQIRMIPRQVQRQNQADEEAVAPSANSALKTMRTSSTRTPPDRSIHRYFQVIIIRI